MTLAREKLDGREVNQFSCIDWNSEGLEMVKSKFEGNFIYHDEYMGDHSEHYIIECNEDKTEKARWNIRNIDWLEWGAKK